MSKPKREKTVLEKLIRRIWHETKRGKDIKTEIQKHIITAIYETLRYLEIDDYVHSNQNRKLFEKIYLSAGLVTQIKLSRELFMGKNVLGNLCKKFMRAFTKIYNDLTDGA